MVERIKFFEEGAIYKEIFEAGEIVAPYEGKNIFYSVSDKNKFKGKKVIIPIANRAVKIIEEKVFDTNKVYKK